MSIHGHGAMDCGTFACVMQEYLLHNAMSIFTFVGNSLAQHDDAYSFQLIARTIDTVIPALITVSIAAFSSYFSAVDNLQLVASQ